MGRKIPYELKVLYNISSKGVPVLARVSSNMHCKTLQIYSKVFTHVGIMGAGRPGPPARPGGGGGPRPGAVGA